MQQLLRTGAVEPAWREDLPMTTRVISGRWVDTEKAPGVCKARWVARGFEDKEAGSEDVNAATTLSQAATLVLAAAASRSWCALVADTSGAFLNAPVKDEEEAIYVMAPPEWKEKAQGKGDCWRLRKALCGLRSAPGRWQEHVAKDLKRPWHEGVQD